MKKEVPKYFPECRIFRLMVRFCVQSVCGVTPGGRKAFFLGLCGSGIVQFLTGMDGVVCGPPPPRRGAGGGGGVARRRSKGGGGCGGEEEGGGGGISSFRCRCYASTTIVEIATSLLLGVRGGQLVDTR